MHGTCTRISRYVSNASLAVISNFRNFEEGTVPSSNGGSYSFDQGDLDIKRNSLRWVLLSVFDPVHIPVRFSIAIVVAREIVLSRRAISH